ncbi:hypothetical protein [Nocardia brasiliensis]|uniref:hypothetical protein n=1 Tax=Nocardia brasiliensis TaxID=37326 RepID=UPI0024558250|nr:hypothetical protein [Nocardia brasiliensis]
MSIETPTPDRDLDDPYIARYAGKVEDPNEMVLRADFARAEAMQSDAWKADSEEGRHCRFLEVQRIRNRWRDRDDEFGEAWWYLNDAYHDWLQDPQFMGELHDQIRTDQAQGWHGLTDVQWRSQLQARELTGHGEWSAEQQAGRGPDRTPGLDGSWADAAEIDTGAAYPVSTEFARARTAAFSTDMPGAPTPGMHRWPDLTNTHQEAEPMTDPTRETSSSSALADYQPSNAVASSVANAERDGATR